MDVQAIQVGRLAGNETFFRGQDVQAIFRRPREIEFPVYLFVLDHPEGRIVIDTGVRPDVRVPGWQRRVVPAPSVGPEEQAGPALRAHGVEPDAVRQVVVTHLDWDHVGGVHHFPNSEILVARREHEFAQKLRGRLRYQTNRWPAGFKPTLYDLDDEPFGPFPRSRRVTERGDVRLVPLAGHSIGQVGVVVETGDVALLFAGDHMLRQDWFVEDLRAGRLRSLGFFFPEQAEETSRRIRAFLHERPTVLLPSHDTETPARLAARETVSL